MVDESLDVEMSVDPTPEMSQGIKRRVEAMQMDLQSDMDIELTQELDVDTQATLPLRPSHSTRHTQIMDTVCEEVRNVNGCTFIF